MNKQINRLLKVAYGSEEAKSDIITFIITPGRRNVIQTIKGDIIIVNYNILLCIVNIIQRQRH